MKLASCLFLALGAVTWFLFGASPAAADRDTTTFCVERPISFDPLFRPSGCFTYKPTDGGITIIGRAILDTGFLPQGGVIEARIGDITCGQTIVDEPDGLYILQVAGDDSIEGCGASGRRLSFTVDGLAARQTLLWHVEQNGDPEFLSLNAIEHTSWYYFERVVVPSARIGTRVEAFTNGTLCGEATIEGEDAAFGAHIRPHLRGFMRLSVSQTGGGCGEVGTLVTFRVGGLRAETVVPWDTNLQRINLLVQGDASCDFLVDARDALLVLQHSAGLDQLILCHSDADHSGETDAFDAQTILQFAAGLISELPA